MTDIDDLVKNKNTGAHLFDRKMVPCQPPLNHKIQHKYLVSTFVVELEYRVHKHPTDQIKPIFANVMNTLPMHYIPRDIHPFRIIQLLT